MVIFNPNKTGGGGAMMAPPLLDISPDNAQSSHHDTLWQFSFEFPAHLDTKFVTPGGTVPKFRNFLYMHVGPKKAQMWFCVQHQCKLSFFT